MNNTLGKSDGKDPTTIAILMFFNGKVPHVSYFCQLVGTELLCLGKTRAFVPHWKRAVSGETERYPPNQSIVYMYKDGMYLFGIFTRHFTFCVFNEPLKSKLVWLRFSCLS